jgi:hypothetical protein
MVGEIYELWVFRNTHLTGTGVRKSYIVARNGMTRKYLTLWGSKYILQRKHWQGMSPKFSDKLEKTIDVVRAINYTFANEYLTGGFNEADLNFHYRL